MKRDLETNKKIIIGILSYFKNDTKRYTTLCNKFKSKTESLNVIKKGEDIVDVKIEWITEEAMDNFIAAAQSYCRSFTAEAAIKAIISGQEVKTTKVTKEKVEVKDAKAKPTKPAAKAKVEKIEKSEVTKARLAKTTKPKETKAATSKAPTKTATKTTKTKATKVEFPKEVKEIITFLKDKDEKFVETNKNIIIDAFKNDTKISITITNIFKREDISDKEKLAVAVESMYRRKPSNVVAKEAYINLGVMVSIPAKKVPTGKVLPKDAEVRVPKKPTEEKTKVEKIKESIDENKDAPASAKYSYEILDFDPAEYYKNSLERRLLPRVIGKLEYSFDGEKIIEEFNKNRETYLSQTIEAFLINNNESKYIVNSNVILNVFKLINDYKLSHKNKTKMLEEINQVLKGFGKSYVKLKDLEENYMTEIVGNIPSRVDINLLNRRLLFIVLQTNGVSEKSGLGFGMFIVPYFVSLLEYDFENTKEVSDDHATIQFTSNSKGINFVLDNEQYSIDITREDYLPIKEAVTESNVEKLRELLRNKKQIEKEIKSLLNEDDIKIVDNKILCNGVLFGGNQVTKYLEYIKEGNLNNITSFKRFLYNLSLNPEIRAQEELFNFVNVNKLRITNLGTIILYKWVRNNYMDQHTNKFVNKPGSKVWMDRNQVNNDKNQTCSRGLHLCSFGYCKFSDKLLLVELHPRDCVSIPTDYNNSKMRCSEYKVLIDITEFYSSMSSNGDFLTKTPNLHHNPVVLEEQIMEFYPNVKRINSFTERNGKTWADIKDNLPIPEEFTFELVRGEEVSDEEIAAIEANMKKEVNNEKTEETKQEPTVEETKTETTEQIITGAEEKSEPENDAGENGKDKVELPEKLGTPNESPKVDVGESSTKDSGSTEPKVVVESDESITDISLLKNVSKKDVLSRMKNELKELMEDHILVDSWLIYNLFNFQFILDNMDALNIDSVLFKRSANMFIKSSDSNGTLNDLFTNKVDQKTWENILITYSKTSASSPSIINEVSESEKLKQLKEDTKVEAEAPKEEGGLLKKVGGLFGKFFK